MVAFDMLHHLTYLSAISDAGVPRSQLFKFAADLPVSTAYYFEEIERVAKSMNYEYAEACQLVADNTNDEDMKNLLLRLAGSLESGEQESDFLNAELPLQLESYGNSYERKIESLKKWTDGYTAAIVSAVLIIVVAAVSTLIYDLGTIVVLGLVGITLVVGCLGGWVIYRTAPKEVKILSGQAGLESQRKPRKLMYILLPLALIAGSLMTMTGVSIGAAMLVMSAVILPLGIASSRLDSRINKLDADAAIFLRVLGVMSTSMGTTPAEAMNRMDLRSMPHLSPYINQLRKRLLARVSPDLCWQRFIADIGSEMVARSVHVFVQGLYVGGEAEEVGARASLLMLKTNFLRAKRKLVSATFGWLVIVLHATISFLLVFVIEIVSGFQDMVQNAGAADVSVGEGSLPIGDLFGFSFQNIQLLQWLTGPVIIAFSFINAAVATIADGGYAYKFFLFMSNTMMSAGLAMVAAPFLANMIFSTASGM